MSPCDCLDHCGSDPALATGKAQPCPKSLALQTTREEASELHLLAFKLAEEISRARVELAGHKVLVNGAVYIDNEPAWSTSVTNDWANGVRQATRFLVLAKHAEQHPTNPHLLRLL